MESKDEWYLKLLLEASSSLKILTTPSPQAVKNKICTETDWNLKMLNWNTTKPMDKQVQTIKTTATKQIVNFFYMF